MSEDTAPPPLITRCINAAGRFLPLSSRLSFDSSRLLALAQKRAGHADFGGEDFLEPLQLLCAATEDQAALSPTGRIALRRYLLDLLVNRLHIERDAARDPQIRSAPVVRPVFILGLPRTGTTLLHNLVAQDPDVRAPQTWEVMYPSPPPANGAGRARIARAARDLRWVDRLAPEFKRIHPVGACLPQECIAITTHALRSIQFHTTQRVPAYQDWLERDDMRPAYCYHRRFLQHLQRHSGARRWVLKAPAHLFALEALFEVYPDACVVQTHRDPLKVVASIASHGVVLRRAFSAAADPGEIARDWSARWASGVFRAMRFRAAHPDLAGRFLDIQYTDLVADPLAAVARLYAHAGMAPDDTARQQMRAFLARHPGDRHGAHRYSLAQFGLDPDEERARFENYTRQYPAVTAI